MPHDASPSASSTAPASSARPGRPRTLDDAKRREVCALVSAGCSLADAARYVACSLSTLKREFQRDPKFHERIRRAEMAAALHPLAVMRNAAATHWRAAAWMLERTMPRRFGRSQPGRFNRRDARRLAADLVTILSTETLPESTRQRLETRIIAAVEYATRIAFDKRRSGRHLRAALQCRESIDCAAANPIDDILPPSSGIGSNFAEMFEADLAAWSASLADPSPTAAPAPQAATGASVSEPPASVPHVPPVQTASTPPAHGTQCDAPNSSSEPVSNPQSAPQPAEAPCPSLHSFEVPPRFRPSNRKTPTEAPLKSPEFARLRRRVKQELAEIYASGEVSPPPLARSFAQKNAPSTIAQNSPPSDARHVA